MAGSIERSSKSNTPSNNPFFQKTLFSTSIYYQYSFLSIFDQQTSKQPYKYFSHITGGVFKRLFTPCTNNSLLCLPYIYILVDMRAGSIHTTWDADYAAASLLVMARRRKTLSLGKKIGMLYSSSSSSSLVSVFTVLFTPSHERIPMEDIEEDISLYCLFCLGSHSHSNHYLYL